MTSMDPRSIRSVSVAMATCNGARFIGDQLASLARQTKRPMELVVTDDCSEDQTLGIVEEFARAAPFPVWINRNGARIGYRANFMRAASLCKGDLVAFCDQDDVWHPEKLATCAAAFAVDGVLLVYHDADLINPAGQTIGTLRQAPSGPSGLPPGARAPLSSVEGFSQVFDYSLMRFSDLWSMCIDPNFAMQPMAHDLWFFFLASALNGIVCLDEKLVAYRQHGGNVFGYRRVSRVGAWVRGLRDRGAKFNLQAAAADRCYEVLNAVAARLDLSIAPQALTSATVYHDFARIRRLRAVLYSSPRARQRAAAWRQLRRSGSYRKTGWTAAPFGACLEDLCLGVPFGPAMTSLGDSVKSLLQTKADKKFSAGT